MPGVRGLEALVRQHDVGLEVYVPLLRHVDAKRKGVRTAHDHREVLLCGTRGQGLLTARLGVKGRYS